MYLMCLWYSYATNPSLYSQAATDSETNSVLSERMFPSAPVKNFSLPVFDVDGYKLWDLQGKKGMFLGNHQIDVHHMRLRTWHGRNPLRLDLTIESVSATLFPQDNRAIGNDYIYIIQSSGIFSIIGRDWSWLREQGNDRVTIKRDVLVTFRHGIGIN